MSENGSWEENRKTIESRLELHERRIDKLEMNLDRRLADILTLVQDLRVDLANWKGRAIVVAALLMLAISAAVSVVVKVL